MFGGGLPARVGNFEPVWYRESRCFALTRSESSSGGSRKLAPESFAHPPELWTKREHLSTSGTIVRHLIVPVFFGSRVNFRAVGSVSDFHVLQNADNFHMP
jgi:hypothetical protein